MATRKNKPENDKKASKKSSASTQEQMSKQDTKGTGNGPDLKSLIEEFKKFQIQLDTAFNTMFRKQDQTSDDIRKFLENVSQKSEDSPRDELEKEKKGPGNENKEYVIFRNAYRNLAQRNLSKKDDINLNVEVSQSYLDKMKKIRKNNQERM